VDLLVENKPTGVSVFTCSQKDKTPVLETQSTTEQVFVKFTDKTVHSLLAFS